ncbi:hypothetical protein AgCh_036627 [Apium graveolens]
MITSVVLRYNLPFSFVEYEGIRNGRKLKGYAIEDRNYVARSLATKMKPKFDKCQADYNTILAIVVVFDPRYKTHFMEFCYKMLYRDDCEQIKLLHNTLMQLFDFYKDRILTYTVVCKPDAGSSLQMVGSDVTKEFDVLDRDLNPYDHLVLDQEKAKSVKVMIYGLRRMEWLGFLEFKMVDGKSMTEQVHEFDMLVHALGESGMNYVHIDDVRMECKWERTVDRQGEDLILFGAKPKSNPKGLLKPDNGVAKGDIVISVEIIG